MTKKNAQKLTLQEFCKDGSGIPVVLPSKPGEVAR